MARSFSTALVLLAMVASTLLCVPTAFAQAPASTPPPGTAGSSLQGPPAPSTAGASDGTAEKLATSPHSYVGDGMAWVMNSILSLFAWLLGVAVITLDNAVYYTVVSMGKVVNQLSAIGVAWRILRDIANIALIFGFLAIGINTILDTNFYGWGNKALPMLLIAAVFLNFSLFVSEAIIDAGNLFATQFYMQINGGQPAGAKTLSIFEPTAPSNDGIANKIMNQLGLQHVYSDTLKNPTLFNSDNSFIIGFMGIILFLVTAFVMFSLAFILIARFVTLILLIVVAPIGFAGLAIPKLKGIADQWWGALVDQTITAPVLLLGLYVALAVITDAQFLTSFGVTSSDSWTSFAGAGAHLADFASILLSFLVAIGLLLGVTVLAKKLGAAGSSQAMKYAGKATFGLTGWAGRTSVGWLANRGANAARSSAFGRIPLLGTGTVRGLDRLASSSFDVRATGALKNFPQGGIDAGSAEKGGYKGYLKGSIEKRVKYAADLKGRDLDKDEKVEVAVLQNQITKLSKDRANPLLTATQIKDIDRQIKEKEDRIEEIESVTDKGARRAYADKTLLLGRNKDGTFNKWINLAANTEAAKKIRSEAKKSSEDKTLEALIKQAKKETDEPLATPPPPAP